MQTQGGNQNSWALTPQDYITYGAAALFLIFAGAAATFGLLLSESLVGLLFGLLGFYGQYKRVYKPKQQGASKTT